MKNGYLFRDQAARSTVAQHAETQQRIADHAAYNLNIKTHAIITQRQLMRIKAMETELVGSQNISY